MNVCSKFNSMLILKLTWRKNSVDKFLSCNLSILIFIDPPKEIHHARLLMVHPSHVFFPPNIKIKVGKFSQLNKKQKELFSAELHQSRTSNAIDTICTLLNNWFFEDLGKHFKYLNSPHLKWWWQLLKHIKACVSQYFQLAVSYYIIQQIWKLFTVLEFNPG